MTIIVTAARPTTEKENRGERKGENRIKETTNKRSSPDSEGIHPGCLPYQPEWKMLWIDMH
jgi:hypothetical protein